MNELTRRLVIETAKSHKALALKNDSDFRLVLQGEWWTHVIAQNYQEKYDRALVRLRKLNPNLFEETDYGELLFRSYEPWIADVEYRITERLADLIIWEANQNPELRLDWDYGDLPVITAQPQMSLGI